MSTNHAPAAAALLVRSQDAERLEGNPLARNELIADGPATGGTVDVTRTLLRPGAVVPPHLHRRSSETFHVLAGAVRALAGDALVEARAGDTLVVPAGAAHALEPVGGDAELLTVLAPGGDRADYFRLLDRVARGEADPAEIGAAQERFDSFFVDSPAWAGRPR